MIQHFPCYAFLRAFRNSGVDEGKMIEFAWDKVRNTPLGTQETWHQFTIRDFYMKAYLTLKIIEAIGFDSYFDVDEKHRYDLDDARVKLHAILHPAGERSKFPEFVKYFDWERDQTLPKHDFLNVSKASLVRVINGILRTLGRQLRGWRTRDQPKLHSMKSIVTIEFKEVHVATVLNQTEEMDLDL